jgi:hypothetical protein
MDVSNSRDLINLVFEKHFPMLLEYTELEDAQAFFDHFTTAAKVPIEAHVHVKLSLEQQYAVGIGEEPLKNLLKALFVQSWNAYLAVQAKQQHQLDLLQEFLESSLKTSASTTPIAMQSDSLTLKSPELQEFFHSATTSNKTKSLQFKVSMLNHHQLNEKTEQGHRQATSPAPSHKNKRARRTNQLDNQSHKVLQMSKKPPLPPKVPPMTTTNTWKAKEEITIKQGSFYQKQVQVSLKVARTIPSATLWFHC